MGHVLVGNLRDNGVLVSCRVGPILFDNFVTLPRRMHVTDLVRFLTDHRTNNPKYTVLLQSLDIKSVMIHKSRIEGILPLFRESMLPPGRCGCSGCVSSVVAAPTVVAVTATTAAAAVNDEDEDSCEDDNALDDHDKCILCFLILICVVTIILCGITWYQQQDKRLRTFAFVLGNAVVVLLYGIFRCLRESNQ